MAHPVLATKNTKEKPSQEQLSKEQRKFNTLKTKLESLQEKINSSGKVYDQALEFYKSDFYPLQIKYLRSMEDIVKILYAIYKNPPKLGRKKKEDLKQIVIAKAFTTLDFAPHEQISPEIFDILEDLDAYQEDDTFDDIFDGIFDDGDEEEDNAIRSEFQEFLDKANLDVDLSNIDFDGTEDEILDAFADLLDVARKKQQGPNDSSFEHASQQKKSKKQLNKEKKEQELASLQKKGLSSVYKQLAKTLHPDLEQNPEVKAEKEVLMKKLTTAYKNNDLHSILSLELEWMDKSGDTNIHTKASSDEQLKIYNTILKDQVEELEITLENLRYDPKYTPISQFCTGSYYPPKTQMTLSLKNLKYEIQFNKETSEALTGQQAEKTLKAILDSYAAYCM